MIYPSRIGERGNNIFTGFVFTGYVACYAKLYSANESERSFIPCVNCDSVVDGYRLSVQEAEVLDGGMNTL